MYRGAGYVHLMSEVYQIQILGWHQGWACAGVRLSRASRCPLAACARAPSSQARNRQSYRMRVDEPARIIAPRLARGRETECSSLSSVYEHGHVWKLARHWTSKGLLHY